jgi:hypothetical protein
MSDGQVYRFHPDLTVDGPIPDDDREAADWMNAREQEAREAFPQGYSWWAARMACRVCGFVCGVTVAAGNDEPGCPVNLQCPHCESMALDVDDEDGDDEELV